MGKEHFRRVIASVIAPSRVALSDEMMIQVAIDVNEKIADLIGEAMGNDSENNAPHRGKPCATSASRVVSFAFSGFNHSCKCRSFDQIVSHSDSQSLCTFGIIVQED